MLTIEQAVRRLFGDKGGYSAAEYVKAREALGLLEKEEVLRKEEYKRYLKSTRWRKLWAYVMKRDGNKCRFCGRKAHHVHHLTYARIFHEEPYDLVAVCKGCHELLHKLD